MILRPEISPIYVLGFHSSQSILRIASRDVARCKSRDHVTLQLYYVIKISGGGARLDDSTISVCSGKKKVHCTFASSSKISCVLLLATATRASPRSMLRAV